jgi:hypothetical protein
MGVDTFAMARVRFKATFMVSLQKFLSPALVMEGNLSTWQSADHNYDVQREHLPFQLLQRYLSLII